VIPQAELEETVSRSLAREEKEAGQRKAIEQGVFTTELLGLTDTLHRLGLR
jgi:4-hydroxy-4-methyl-2-oxoglutarate aldolase